MPHPERAAPPSSTAESLFDEGTQCLRRGRVDEALALLRASVALQPRLGAAHANLALALERSGDDEAADTHYRRALELAPGLLFGWINHGAFLDRRKDYAQAERAYRQALRIDPRSAAAWMNLGVLLDVLRRPVEAEQALRAAVERAPEWPLAAVNLAECLLRQGRMAEGWPWFEARDWSADFAARVGLPRWDGAPLRGRALLIGVEGGHGDMIQVCRYAAELKRRGAGVVGVLCHPGLRTLLQGADGVDHAIAVGPDAGGSLPDVPWNLWCPALSLPALCGTRLDSIPAELPYLRAEARRMASWAPALGTPGKALRVGLAWKGNPRFANDRERSLESFADLAPLAGVPGVRLFSLQKGPGEEEPGRDGMPVAVSLGAGLRDFADTAAVVAQLDLVISVDTALAHLAGALARPCWVLLPHHRTDWRWLEERRDTPWYPGVMRLYRQRLGEDWSRVVGDVARDLRRLAGG